MPLNKILHFVSLILIIIFFSWLNSKPSSKESFHPRLRQEYRNGMRNMKKVKEGLDGVKRQAFRSISKKLGY